MQKEENKKKGQAGRKKGRKGKERWEGRKRKKLIIIQENQKYLKRTSLGLLEDDKENYLEATA